MVGKGVMVKFFIGFGNVVVVWLKKLLYIKMMNLDVRYFF